MNSVPTFRQGRSYIAFGAADRGGCAGVLAILFVLTLLVIPPMLLLVSESIRHDTYTALMEVLQDDIKELGGSNIHAGDMVHAVSHDISVLTPGRFGSRNGTCHSKRTASQTSN